MGRALFLRLIAATAAAGFLATMAGASVSRPALHVSTDGNGVIASRDGRIDCGARCSARYRRGAVVSLAAIPDQFFAFSRWGRGCVGTAARCFVSVDGATTVRAFFARRTVRVTLSVSGPGTVTSADLGIVCGKSGAQCDAEAPAGTSVTLSATPESGGLFGKWSDPCGPEAQCSIVLDRDVELLAAFAHQDPDPDQPQLTVVPEGSHVTSDPPGIDCPPTCQAEFPSGTLVTIQGNITKWNGLCVGVARQCAIILDNSDGAGTGGPPPPPAPEQLGLNVAVSGPGTVTAKGGIKCGRTTLFDCEGLYPRGAKVVLRATPGRRGRFVFWSGFCFGKKQTCTLRVTGPKTVQALFRR
jgi:Divergent InlB B-repeat domain